MQSSAVTLRGRTFKFWRRSRTRTSARGSASATTRRRKRDNTSQDIKPVPSTHSGFKPTPFHPAFVEGRAANEPAVMCDWFHDTLGIMQTSKSIVTRLWFSKISLVRDDQRLDCIDIIGGQDVFEGRHARIR